jgi:hypothetical protein
MKAINLGVLTLVHLAGPALAATCYRPNAAGGEIPYACVRGEELEGDAPGLPESNIIVPDTPAFDAIEAAPAEPAVPARKVER